MIKVRLLKNRAGDFSQLLDSADLPALESLDDIKVVVRIIGKLMKPYAEAMRDPNIVPAMSDTSIETWTVSDLQSIQYELSRQGFDLLITEENGEDLTLTSSQVKFLLVDSSTKALGYFPYGESRVYDLKDAVDSLSVIDALDSMLSNTALFDLRKFNSNPIKDMLKQLQESRQILGTLNMSAMNRLNMALLKLNRKLYAFSLA